MAVNWILLSFGGSLFQSDSQESGLFVSVLEKSLGNAALLCGGGIGLAVGLPGGAIETAVGLAGLAEYGFSTKQRHGPECARIQKKMRRAILKDFQTQVRAEGNRFSATEELRLADDALAHSLTDCFVNHATLAQAALSPETFPKAAIDHIMGQLAASNHALFGPGAAGTFSYNFAHRVVTAGVLAALESREYWDRMRPYLEIAVAQQVGKTGADVVAVKDDVAAMREEMRQGFTDLMMERERAETPATARFTTLEDELNTTRQDFLGLLKTVLDQDVAPADIPAALELAKEGLTGAREELEGLRRIANQAPDIQEEIERARATLTGEDMIDLAAAQDAIAAARRGWLEAEEERRRMAAETTVALYTTEADLAAARLRHLEAAELLGKAAEAAEGRARMLLDDRSGQAYLTHGLLAPALEAFEDAMRIAKARAAEDPADDERARDTSVSLERVGDVRRAQGDLPGALAVYEEGLVIRRDLAARDPGNAGWARDTSVSLERIGDVRRAQGDLPGALAVFEEGLVIRRDLAARDPGNAGWARDTSVSLDRIGDVRVAQGDLPGALAVFEEGLVIRRDLAARDPGNAGWARDTSVSLNKVGDVRVAQGDLPGALAVFEEGLVIRRDLAARDPGNAGWARDTSVSLDRIGDVRVAQGDLPGALAVFEEGLVIRRDLAARDPGNAGWARDTSVSLERVGDVRRAQGDLPGALAVFEEGLVIRRDLAARDPGNAGWARDTSVSLDRIGDVRVAQGDLPGALAVFEEGLVICRDLAARDPGNAGWARDVVVSLWRMARYREGDTSDIWSEVVERMEDMKARGILLVADEKFLTAARQNLAAARGD